MDTIFFKYLECDLVKKKLGFVDVQEQKKHGVYLEYDLMKKKKKLRFADDKEQKEDGVYVECELMKKKLGFVDVQEQKEDGVYLECDLVKSKYILLRNVLSHYYLHPSPNLREQYFRVQLTLPTPTKTRFHQLPTH
jgi:hypothetical protein